LAHFVDHAQHLPRLLGNHRPVTQNAATIVDSEQLDVGHDREEAQPTHISPDPASVYRSPQRLPCHVAFQFIERQLLLRDDLVHQITDAHDAE